MDYKLNENLRERLARDSEACIDCKLCMKGCPMLEEFTSSPKALLEILSREASYSLDLPYTCMLCGYCREVCPKGIDFNSIFMEMREEIFQEEEGQLPKELSYAGVKFHQKNSFSKLFSTNIRNLASSTVFFPGCALMAYSPELVDKTYGFLESKIEGIGIYVSCCGKPSQSMGDQDRFKSYFSRLEEEFSSKGVDTVIVACLNCYKTIKENTSSLKVKTIWELVLEEGIPEARKGIARDYNFELLLHDPCPTRDIDRVHQGARRALEDMGFKYSEMNFNRRRTLCCGSGGMVGISRPDLANRRRRARAEEKPEEVIVTYCEECVESMKAGGKKAIHILDLLFNDEIYKSFNQEDMTLLSKWSNRFKARIKFNRY